MRAALQAWRVWFACIGGFALGVIRSVFYVGFGLPLFYIRCVTLGAGFSCIAGFACHALF